MSTFSFSQPGDPTSFEPYSEHLHIARNKTDHICNCCCERMKLWIDGDHILAECPDHMKLIIQNGTVILAETKGPRQ